MLSTVLLQMQTEKPVHAAADEFVKMDPWGFGMMVIAMTIVFIVLIIIYLIFRTIGKMMVRNALKKVSKKEDFVMPSEISAETVVAIGLALHLYTNQQHDLDSMKITIQKVSKMYSPWSSKIYTLRGWPR